MATAGATRKSDRLKDKDEKEEYTLPPPLQLTENKKVGASSTPRKISPDEEQLDKQLEELEKSISETESQLQEIDQQKKLKEKKEKLERLQKQLRRNERKIKKEKEEEGRLLALRKETKQSMKFAYAESTFKNLHIQWETFLMFCYYYKLEPLPVSVDTLCLYGQFLNRSFRSVQSIQNYLSGVKTLHTLLDLEYPTSDLFQLKLLLKGISRIKQHIPKKAAPITPQILKEIYTFLNFDSSFDIVLWAVFLLMFFLMARKSNMIPTSVKKFDSKKQLIRGDLKVENDEKYSSDFERNLIT